jgi:hypothetical protein
MRQFRLLVTAAAIAAVSVTTAAAQGKSGSAPRGGGPSVTATSPKGGDHAGGGHKGSAGANAHGGAAKAGKAKTGKDGNDKPDSAKRPEGKPSAPGTGRGVNDVASKISNNPEQLARIEALLPKGMTLEQASAGFKNQGQFIAALNASKNQGVDFADLQTAMTTDGLSLGQAVKQLKPAN